MIIKQSKIICLLVISTIFLTCNDNLNNNNIIDWKNSTPETQGLNSHIINYYIDVFAQEFMGIFIVF